jgi:hypothetical protein
MSSRISQKEKERIDTEIADISQAMMDEISVVPKDSLPMPIPTAKSVKNPIESPVDTRTL